MSVELHPTCTFRRYTHGIVKAAAPPKSRTGRRLLADRRGSETLSSLIIATTILVVTLVSANVATHMIELQVAQAEYNEAKEAMVILADIVEEVGSKTYSSSYVKFNCRSGRLDFLKNSTHVKVVLRTELENLTLIDTYTSSLRYKSGSRFSVVEEYVRGGADPILGEEAAPLVSIYTGMDQDGAPAIWFYSGSIRLIEEGTMYLEGRGCNVTVYELVFVKIRIGATFGSGSLNVKAYGKAVSINTQLVENSGTVHLVVNGQEKDSASIAAPALIYVAVAEVEVATV